MPGYHCGMADLIVTLIGPDHPGIVESVAEAVASHGGNWLESRMAHLAGRFAGVLRVEAAAERIAELEAALAGLQSSGLRLVVERGASTAAEALHAMEIELLGLDRPGLVRQVSDLLAARRINVLELRTDRFSAPMSGELLFRAQLHVDVPASVSSAELRQDLERLAADLMVEIRVAEALRAPR
jgi:glycine cleavage system regulatory protein